MRYYRTTLGGETRFVARDGEKAYDLSVARDELNSFVDLARVADVLDRNIDDVAADVLDDAPLVDAETVVESAKLPAMPDEVWAAGVTYQTSSDCCVE